MEAASCKRGDGVSEQTSRVLVIVFAVLCPSGLLEKPADIGRQSVIVVKTKMCGPVGGSEIHMRAFAISPFAFLYKGT